MSSFVSAADVYPSKSIKVIVPFPPGGGADTLIRLIAPTVGELWKQSIVIENRPGASGFIGADLVAQSPADGYTLLMGSTAAVTEKNIAQFSPVALVSASPYVVTTNSGLNVTSIKALIAYAKSNPGKVRYGSSGPGSASHLAGELFASMAGVTLLHVPYKGTGQALTDLLAGHIDLMFAPAQTVMPQIESGKLLALAQTGAKRSEALPNIPTVAESGLPGYSAVGWFGLFAPANTPKSVVQKINQTVMFVLAQERIRKAMLERGSDPASGSAEEFAAFLRLDQSKWAKLIKENKIAVQ
ncbi:tripartite tricarboxylate transporter substrate binding protein [Polynucleobacter sp. AP-Sanab-80-C2]|uniref:tripartite tricarboxylate transporter substrate binding protein n=1 Tax=Polynucleobacter sp. AP-Sanab-80-C2 TaxID=3108274 RepID=UPI002B223650|nr:tripartite tricarboxylate transporter substrate binding protein [Polynucleobacter sp. AP-Sanab-80-C2]MEA9599338.1 tripartite tricarboxylate transporter substrate binding protein [Polynucleobacter sp. AP-Sanab-80-C2]QWE05907.1 tripartite tricarboxylate transporter substrate binding protein [Polynucleobacter sp. JS-JIR-5-A7]